jgi:hypothetical protein
MLAAAAAGDVLGGLGLARGRAFPSRPRAPVARPVHPRRSIAMPDTTADDQVRADAAEPDNPLREEVTEPDSPPPWEPAPPSMIRVSQLTAHPGNVRQDLDLTPEFVASVAELGVRVPLLITCDDAGRLRVIEGHRRLAAALKAGLAEVPCVLDADRASDQAGQFLDMLIANSGGYRKNLTRSRRRRPCSPRMRPARPGPGSASPPAARPRMSRPRWRSAPCPGRPGRRPVIWPASSPWTSLPCWPNSMATRPR